MSKSLGFNDYVIDQMVYGGQKYALKGSETRESTDQLFDDYGKNWLFGTMDKYCKRSKNLPRERDILKIGCYCYILWLKRGFHLNRVGFKVDAVDTNLQNKKDNWPLFIKRFDEEYGTQFITSKWYQERKTELDGPFLLDTISIQLKSFARSEWKDILEKNILLIYGYCKIMWEQEYAAAVKHDTDTGK